VFAITSAGGVIRTSAAEIKQSGRQTMGVRLVNLGDGQSLVAIARNAESLANGSLEADPDDETDPAAEAELAVPDRDETDISGSADAESGDTE
jgi:DNA gyrase subunit A